MNNRRTHASKNNIFQSSHESTSTDKDGKAMSLDRQQCILSSLENIKEQDDEIQETGNADQMACHDDKEETSPYQCMATQSDDANYQEEEIDGFNEEEQIHTVKKSMV